MRRRDQQTLRSPSGIFFTHGNLIRPTGTFPQPSRLSPAPADSATDRAQG